MDFDLDYRRNTVGDSEDSMDFEALQDLVADCHKSVRHVSKELNSLIKSKNDLNDEDQAESKSEIVALIDASKDKVNEALNKLSEVKQSLGSEINNYIAKIDSNKSMSRESKNEKDNTPEKIDELLYQINSLNTNNNIDKILM